MTAKELKDITLSVTDIARKVSLFLKINNENIKSEQIESKGLNDFVTRIDKEAEEMLVSALTLLLPEAGFIAEEGSGSEIEGAYNWIIDPLDGTTNYLHSVPVYCISIALSHADEIISGVVFEVVRDECFYAWKEGGAWLNGKAISVSQSIDLSHSLLATGFPYKDFGLMDRYLALLASLMEKTRGIRRLGSAAADLAYVACGRFDAFYEYGLNAWDIAAGTLIVSEAGGRNGDFSGSDDFIEKKQLVSSNSKIYEELLAEVNRLMEG